MEEYITRTEFERQIAQLREEMKHRQTDEIPAVNVNVASADVIARLDKLEQELNERSTTWLNTLQQNYDEHKEALSDVKTVQSGHSKYFEEHGKRLAATSTKDDISRLESATATKDDLTALKATQDARFDRIEGLIMQLLQQKQGE